MPAKMSVPVTIVNVTPFGKILLWNILVLLTCDLMSVSGDTGQLLNSTAACTRGRDKTLHQLICEEKNGTASILAVSRLFYGTVPKTSGCNLTAPYQACCHQDPDKNCIFESDFKLDEISVKCSGKPICRFYGQTVMTSRGNCDSKEFPSITSFSFMQYSCLLLDDLIDVCPKEEQSTDGLQLYLDSNFKNINEHLDNDDECSCVLYSQCGTTIILEAILVQLRRINSTKCVEEMTVTDLKDGSNLKKYTCLDHQTSLAINNEIMLESTSNAVLLKLHIFEKHNGKILITAKSSDPSQPVNMKCGPEVSAQSLPSDYYCSGEVIPVFTPEPTSPEGDLQNGEQAGNNGDKGGKRVIVEKDSEELHSGAIAGIVLAAIGILLVISQVLYFLIRRRQKRMYPHDDRSTFGGSSTCPSQLTNPSFAPEILGDFPEDDEHIYDLAMGTVRGRESGLYNTYIQPDGREVFPEKDVTDFSQDDADDYFEVTPDKDYLPPPPYDNPNKMG